jgi:hypothetical protein
MLAPAVPVWDEVLKPGKICQHWKTDTLFSAAIAVMLRNDGGTNDRGTG